MGSEYIKLSKPEVIYAQKNFLNAQLDILDITKHYLEYQKARKAEFLLKIDLKNKIEYTKSQILMFERMLPKVQAETGSFKKLDFEKESKGAKNLQKEIDLIKQKLASLR